LRNLSHNCETGFEKINLFDDASARNTVIQSACSNVLSDINWCRLWLLRATTDIRVGCLFTNMFCLRISSRFIAFAIFSYVHGEWLEHMTCITLFASV